VCRYQDVSKESQTRGHSVRIVWQIEAQKKCAFVRVVSVQAKFCVYKIITNSEIEIIIIAAPI